MNKREISDIALQLLAGAVRGGATVATMVNDAPPREGFAVGEPTKTLVITQSQVDVSSIEYWISKNIDSRYLGIWTHLGNVYLDRVAIVPTVELALALAREHGELAIYDLANKTGILV